MSCICCFFDPQRQFSLKRRTFSDLRFEDRLEKYKNVYLDEIDSLSSVKNCNCKYARISKKYPLFKNTTDEMLKIIKNDKVSISSFFQSFINIYIDYITNGAYQAINKFSDFLIKEDLITGRSISPIEYNQLLFRARPKEAQWFTENDLFHVPFSLRCKISNQRFSVSGQPMLYLTKSIITAKKELDKDFDKLQFAAFVPNYSYYYDKKIFNLSHYIYDSIVKTLPALCGGTCKDLGPNIDLFDIRNIKREIMTNILMFPCNTTLSLKIEKKSFTEEYVLPQMFTSIIENNSFAGIEYPSSKINSSIYDEHLFSDYNKNVAFFVKYQKANNFDMDLRNSFLMLMQDQSGIGNITLEQVKTKLYKIKAPQDGNNYNDWIIPIAKTQRHLEDLENAKIDKEYYFNTKEGKLELFFMMKLCREMKQRIKYWQLLMNSYATLWGSF